MHFRLRAVGLVHTFETATFAPNEFNGWNSCGITQRDAIFEPGARIGLERRQSSPGQKGSATANQHTPRPSTLAGSQHLLFTGRRGFPRIVVGAGTRHRVTLPLPASRQSFARRLEPGRRHSRPEASCDVGVGSINSQLASYFSQTGLLIRG